MLESLACYNTQHLLFDPSWSNVRSCVFTSLVERTRNSRKIRLLDGLSRVANFLGSSTFLFRSQNTGMDVQQKFDTTTFGKFMRECINQVLEKSPNDRNHMSKLLSHLLKQNIVPVQSFKNGWVRWVLLLFAFSLNKFAKHAFYSVWIICAARNDEILID